MLYMFLSLLIYVVFDFTEKLHLPFTCAGCQVDVHCMDLSGADLLSKSRTVYSFPMLQNTPIHRLLAPPRSHKYDSPYAPKDQSSRLQVHHKS